MKTMITNNNDKKRTELEIFKHCFENNIPYPIHFWTIENTKLVLRYLYENDIIVYKDLKQKGFSRRLKELKLYFILNNYMSLTSELIEYMTNNKVKVWENLRVPNGYWNDHNNVKNYVLWFCETKGWDEDQIPKKLKMKDLIPSIPMMYSIDDVIKISFGNKYSIYDFKRPASYWDDDINIKNYVKYVIEEQHKLKTRSEIAKLSRWRWFKGAVTRKYRLFELLDITYPEYKFHKWELDTPDFKTNNDIKTYMHWYLFEKLKIKKSEILEKFDYNMIPRGLQLRFTVKEIIHIVFDGKYDLWDFKNTNMYWTKQDYVISYIEWLMKKENILIHELQRNIGFVIKKYGISISPKNKLILLNTINQMVIESK